MDTEPSKKKEITIWDAISIVWDLLFTIAIPTVFFALLGRWADKRLGTTPMFLVAGLILALSSVAFLMVRKGKRLLKIL
jgi:F0F1-type ATP synthase assembly protein I